MAADLFIYSFLPGYRFEWADVGRKKKSERIRKRSYLSSLPIAHCTLLTFLMLSLNKYIFREKLRDEIQKYTENRRKYGKEMQKKKPRQLNHMSRSLHTLVVLYANIHDNCHKWCFNFMNCVLYACIHCST